MPNNGWVGSRDQAKRISNAPLISGDSFREFADHVFDEASMDRFDFKAIQPGDTIFLNTVFLFHFAQNIHPLIPNPYVLICHNSDMPVPDYHVEMLEDPKMIAWFSPNIMIPNHPKLHVIPLGVNNAYYNKTGILIHEMDLSKRDAPHCAYLNFSKGTNSLLRDYVWDVFYKKDFCMIAQNRSYQEYLQDMKKCTFVISPAGYGIDCYRHWEALLMGCIPIMRHSTIDRVFDDLPVILVHDWSVVTKELIMAEYALLQTKKCNYKKLLIDYWFDQIRAVQKKFREGTR